MGGPGGGGRGGMRGGPGGPGGAGGRFGGAQGAPPPVAGAAGGSSSSATGQLQPPAGFSTGGGNATNNGAAGGGAGFGGGGRFGGNANLTAALSYAGSHGGGAIAVSSQEGAADSIIQSGADVVGLGGFSGRESQVSAQWLAQAVQNGQIRYVLTGGETGGMGNDSRVGANDLMAIVQKVGKPTSVSGLYDLQGQAAAIAAAG
jgi:hypothetical protein